jgi:hypothetical protein
LTTPYNKEPPGVKIASLIVAPIIPVKRFLFLTYRGQAPVRLPGCGAGSPAVFSFYAAISFAVL